MSGFLKFTINHRLLILCVLCLCPILMLEDIFLTMVFIVNDRASIYIPKKTVILSGTSIPEKKKRLLTSMLALVNEPFN